MSEDDEKRADDIIREINRNFDVHHPHDHFFRGWMGSPEIASEFFKFALPKSLTPWIENPERIELEDASFVDEELRGSQSDLLFRCWNEDESKSSFVYVLFEHQRVPEAVMPMRIFLYLSRIWERFLREDEMDLREKKFPFIFPIVLYQGDSDWSHSTEFRDVVDEPEASLMDFLPNFRFQLVSLKNLNLDHLSPGDLRTGLMAMTLALRAFRENWRPLISEVLRVTGTRNYFIFRYALAVLPENERNIMIQETKQNPGQDTEKFVSIADSLMAEGMEKGMEKGRLESARRFAIEMQKDGYPIERLADITGLSVAEIEALTKEADSPKD